MRKLTSFLHNYKNFEVKVQLTAYQADEEVEGFCMNNTHYGKVGVTLHFAATGTRFISLEKTILDTPDAENVALNDAVVAVLKKLENGRWA